MGCLKLKVLASNGTHIVMLFSITQILQLPQDAPRRSSMNASEFLVTTQDSCVKTAMPKHPHSFDSRASVHIIHIH